MSGQLQQRMNVVEAQVAAVASVILAEDAPVDPVVLVASTAHRMSRSDLDELGDVLVPRICSRHPDKNHRAVFTWLCQAMTQNDMLFIRAGGGVALCQMHTSFLARPWVEVVFVFAQPGKELDAIGCFQDIRKWSVNLGAVKIVIDEDFCDVERADIAMEIGSVKRVPQSVVWLVEKEKPGA